MVSLPSLSPVCRASCPASADSHLEGRHLRRDAAIVDRCRSSFDPGVQIVGDTGGDQPGPGVEDDDVASGARLTAEHATADLGVGEGVTAGQIVVGDSGESEVGCVDLDLGDLARLE